MKKQILIILIILCSAALEAIGQKYLVFEKLGTHRRFEYKVGDKFTFRAKGEEFFRTSIIEDLVDSVIVFDYGFYTFKEIEKIVVRGEGGKSYLSKFAFPLMAAGVVLFAGDQFNETVISGSKASINKGVTIASGALIGVGLLTLINLSTKKVKGNWRLRLVDI